MPYSEDISDYPIQQIIRQAIAFDSHVTLGDISTTQLIDAPQIRQLRKVAGRPDPMAGIWAMLGTAIHAMLEWGSSSPQARTLKKTIDILVNKYKELEGELETPDLARKQKIIQHMNQIKQAGEILRWVVHEYFTSQGDRFVFEQTMSFIVDGMEISMTYDVYDKEDQHLWDYKLCSVYQYIYPQNLKKWTKQMNIYGVGMSTHGLPVKKATVVGIFRDWSGTKYTKNSNYPPAQITPMPIKLYPKDQIVRYIKERVALHRRAETGESIPCSPEERWADSDVFKVFTINKANQKQSNKALKVSNKEQDVLDWIAENKHRYSTIDLQVHHDLGQSKRCEKFCPVSLVCPQWAILKQA